MEHNPPPNVDRETWQSTRVDRVSKYFKSSNLRESLREKCAEPIVISPFCLVARFFNEDETSWRNSLGIVSKFLELELERFEGRGEEGKSGREIIN